MEFGDLVKNAAKNVINTYFAGFKKKLQIIGIGVATALVLIFALFGAGDTANAEEASNEEGMTTEENYVVEIGDNGKATVGGTEILTYTSSRNKTYIMYEQAKGPWASKIYAEGHTISEWGCPAAATATALSGLGYNLTPDKFTAIYSRGKKAVIEENGAKIENTQIYGECPHDTTKVPSENDKNKIIGYLQEGYPVIFHVTGSEKRSGKSIFTGNQHWMVLLDVNEEKDKIYVAAGTAKSVSGWYSIDTALTSLCCYAKVYK